jgi:hypothetical protein
MDQDVTNRLSRILLNPSPFDGVLSATLASVNQSQRFRRVGRRGTNGRHALDIEGRAQSRHDW